MLLVVVVAFPHWRFLRFRATLPCHRHSTLACDDVKASNGSELYPGYSFTASATVLSGDILPKGVFYLTLLDRYFWHVFVTQMHAGTPHPTSTLTELSLPADTWS